MSSKADATHRLLLDLTRSVLEQLDQPTSLGAPDHLRPHLQEQIHRIQEAARDLYPAVRQSRLADLSTRLAVHYFTERSIHSFCEKVLDELIPVTGARTGALVLFTDHSTEVEIVATRSSKRESLEPGKIRISRSVLARIRDGEPSVLVGDALSDEGLSIEESVRELTLRSVIAISLRLEDYLAGAVFLENEVEPGAFDEEDRHLLIQVGRLLTVYLDTAFRLKDEIAARRKIYSELKGKTLFDGIVGTSPQLLQVLETVEQAGPTNATVIIEGESGTGKELVARGVHKSSRRSERPFFVVNCAAIPDALLESELFGHERGAFTGAVQRQIGRLELANKSTVFLDEIGELSTTIQAKLLRFLQSQEIERLGGSKTIQLDVRLVAATNRDIEAMVKRGDFREDLYYRLNVIPIRVPPIRERPEDIPLLVDHFVEVFSLQSARKSLDVDPKVHELLQQYPWPGNVRELENLIQRLVVLCKSGRIEARDLPPHIAQGSKISLDIDKNPFGSYLANLPQSWTELKRRRKQMLHIASAYGKKLEDKFVDSLLDRTDHNISRAAQESGMHRTLIHRNLKARND